jgi:hypothetical protein
VKGTQAKNYDLINTGHRLPVFFRRNVQVKRMSTGPRIGLVHKLI